MVFESIFALQYRIKQEKRVIMNLNNFALDSSS